MSFTAFCQIMSTTYQTTHPDSLPFVSTKTWVKWWFGWAVALKIDFRKHIDPFCGHDPPMLVVDGTHYGPAIRHAVLTSADAVTGPEQAVVKHPKHRR
jgi:hypothetical protein